MSGFIKSFESGVWSPMGAPAIAKLIEALDQPNVEARIVFSAKSAQRARRHNGFSNLRLKTILLNYHGWAGFLGDRIGFYINEIVHLFWVLINIARFKPDVIYVDRSNILIASCIARLTKIPIVVRILGAPSSLRDVVRNKKSIYCRLYRWAYRAKYALVIGSMDGTSIKQWFREGLSPLVPRIALLNGVEPYHQNIKVRSDEKIHILILGRLDEYKRTDLIIRAILNLPSKYLSRCEINVVGDGDLREALFNMVSDAGLLNRIIFHGAIAHDEIGSFLFNSDIYISMNKVGNLSNANLEAMQAGLAFIIPEANPVAHADMETHEIISTDMAIRVDNNNLCEGIQRAICELIDDPARVERMKLASKKCAAKLMTWDERINLEIRMISQVAAGKMPDMGFPHWDSIFSTETSINA